MNNIFITGITGVMGGHLVKIIERHPNCNVVGGLGHVAHTDERYPIYTNFSEIPSNLEIDCIIDFSNASIVDALLDFAVGRKLPLVLCTTGLSEKTNAKVMATSEQIPIFKSGNMSLGINAISHAIKLVSELLDESYDVEIIEKHHNRKLDAPSGTALMLADAVNQGKATSYDFALGRPAHGAKEKSVINIHSVRGGNIVGDHEVLFAGEEELIEIKHTALDRGVFAKGAVEAAQFLVHQAAGLYDMNHLIQEKLSKR